VAKCFGENVRGGGGSRLLGESFASLISFSACDCIGAVLPPQFPTVFLYNYLKEVEVLEKASAMWSLQYEVVLVRLFLRSLLHSLSNLPERR
jgi:hypothetical protein